MAMEETLSRAECLSLLSDRSVGRVAISRHALPAILPVAYGLLGDDIVFGPGAGTSGWTELHRNVIAFETDDINSSTGRGWSVVVVGIARRFDGEDPDWLDALDPGRRRWAGRPAANLFRLPTLRISGRRLAPAH